MNLIKMYDLFLLEEIVKKNFLSKYKESVLGVMWTILSPLLMMALFTIVFSTLFSRNIDNFAVYFLCGWCLFQFFTSSISASMDSLKNNKSILKRTPAPKYIFVLGGILSEFLNFLIMLILLMIIMFITHAPFYFPILFCSIVPIILLFILIVGLGLMVSIACVYYTDIRHLWSVLSLMLMYASAIFYPMDIIPEPFRGYFLLNPLYWAINQFRCFVYQGIAPNGINLLNFLLLSMIILICGVIVFRKYDDKVVTKF